jgi:hypothetical protein
VHDSVALFEAVYAICDHGWPPKLWVSAKPEQAKVWHFKLCQWSQN